MKKNLLSVLILVLLLVNIALTAVMLISVTGTNTKTAALVDTIATVMNLELSDNKTGGGANAGGKTVSLADTAIYAISDSMTTALRVGEDGAQKYMVCDVAFSLDTKDEDYATYGEAVVAGSYESLIKDAVASVIATHTEAEIRGNMDGLKKEVLQAVQNLFGSDFIYSVAISEVKFG